MHQWYQQRHHTIMFLGFHNIYKVLAAPNGTEFTICQVIMSNKCSEDLITPLFVAVDVSPEGDVVIVYDVNLRNEAEVLLSHFGIYLAYIFGSVVWEAFTVSYKASMEPFQYCPVKNYVIERDTSNIASDESFDQ